MLDHLYFHLYNVHGNMVTRPPVCAELIIGCCMTQQDIAAFPPVCPGYEAANYLVC